MSSGSSGSRVAVPAPVLGSICERRSFIVGNRLAVLERRCGQFLGCTRRLILFCCAWSERIYGLGDTLRGSDVVWGRRALSMPALIDE